MRRLIAIDCHGAALGATLDGAEGALGLLLVTGGSQTRIGSHRMYEMLAKDLAKQGISCLRFDRRGVGDSAGADPGYRGSGPDLAAAAAALRGACPGLRKLYGFGLCDGATALALFGRAAGLDGLILVNPWLVETEADAPPAAAIRRRYRERLTSWQGWKDLLSGAVDIGKLLKGVARMFRREDASLMAEIAAALERDRLPAQLILASGDATAIAAEAELRKSKFSGLLGEAQRLETDSHTFARPGDAQALAAAVASAVHKLELQAV
jgi:exosortase A-associated hydrolase 1